MRVVTFVVKPTKRRDGFWTSAEYVSHIVSGLRSHNVPEDYVEHVIMTAIETNRRVADGALVENQLIQALVQPAPPNFLAILAKNT